MNRTVWTALILALIAAGLAATAVRSQAEGVGIRKVVQMVSGTTPLDPFRNPMTLAADPDRGVLIVADSGNNRLAVFDDSWRCRGTISCTTEESPGQPTSVAMDSRGRLFVVDATRRSVEVLTSRGSPIALLTPPLPDAGPDARAEAVAVGAGGSVYILYGGSRPGFVVLNSRGEAVTYAGFQAREHNVIQGPTAIAVDPLETRVAITDPLSPQEVHVFTTEGRHLRSFGGHGEGEGTFSVAQHVTWGPGETLWITDQLRHSISVFDAQGQFLGRLGGAGIGPGQFMYPVACAFVDDGRILVLERVNARFQVLDVGVPAVGTLSGVPKQPGGTADGEEVATLKGRSR